MKYISSLEKEECSERIKESFDSRLGFVEERYVGWMKGPFFSMTYYSGEEVNRRIYPFIKVLGVIRRGKKRTEIGCVYFYGLTDPISIIVYYLFSFFVLSFKVNEQGITFSQIALISLMPILPFSVISFLFSFFSEKGIEGHERLEAKILKITHAEQFKKENKEEQ
ncbi:hypothetical protein [Anaeromicropila populeti]|uniref:Uncharacterized protein n=1 Tax=Anaeromicropila populeti TaxID=37658 RepID=A0A1I6JDN9_9FIRM|nr:hypothetical protein [Anaeromicropila populeti]SFR76700.1 hypothetical protein SAMN05661086_01566 [Anaeromicropila populeti]